MKYCILVYVLTTIVFSSSCWSQDNLETLYRIVQSNPNGQLTLLDGRVRIVDVYKRQITSLYESRSKEEAERISQYVDDVYPPYREFWDNFFLNKEGFAKWARKHWQKIEDIRSPGYQIPFEVSFDSLFTVTVARMKDLTSRQPRGTWYLAYGNMASDIGGFYNGDMFVDFFGIGDEGPAELIFVLPHEINHQIFGKSNPDDHTLLYTILDEGFACYINYLYWNKSQSPATNISFTEEEWQWCLDNEARIFEYARAFLDSTSPAIIGKFQKAHRHIFDGAPDRIAYFIGFRICQAYVQKFGTDAWRRIYDLKPREILASSEYEKAVAR